MDLKLTSMFQTCKHCALLKAKKDQNKQITVTQSKIKGERLYLDISSPSMVSLGKLVVGHGR